MRRIKGGFGPVACIIALMLLIIPLTGPLSIFLFKPAQFFVLQAAVWLSAACLLIRAMRGCPPVLMRTPMDKWLFAIMGLMILSSLKSDYTLKAPDRIIECGALIGVFYLTVYAVRNTTAIRIMLYAALAGTGIACVIGLAQFAGLIEVDWTNVQWGTDFGKRIFATQGNPNWFASMLVVAAPVYLAMALRAGRRIIGICWWIGFAVVSTCILLTNSWAAIAGLMVALVFLKMHVGEDAKERTGLYFRLSMWMLALSLFLMLVIKGVSMGGTPLPFLTRCMHWQTAWHIFLDHSWVGAGTASFEFLSARYEAMLYQQDVFLPLVDSVSYLRKSFRAHNELIGLLAENGVMMPALVLGACVAAYRMFKDSIRRTTSFSQRLLFAGLGAGVLGLFIDAQLGFPYHLIAPAAMHSVWLGIIAGSDRGSEAVGAAGPGPGSRWSRRWLTGLAVILMCIWGLWMVKGLAADVYAAKAQAHESADRLPEAKKNYLISLRLDKRQSEVRFRLAVVLKKLREYAAAMEELAVLEKQEPYLWHIPMNQGIVHEALQNSKAAMMAYQRVLEIKSYHPSARSAVNRLFEKEAG